MSMKLLAAARAGWKADELRAAAADLEAGTGNYVTARPLLIEAHVYEETLANMLAEADRIDTQVAEAQAELERLRQAEPRYLYDHHGRRVGVAR